VQLANILHLLLELFLQRILGAHQILHHLEVKGCLSLIWWQSIKCIQNLLSHRVKSNSSYRSIHLFRQNLADLGFLPIASKSMEDLFQINL